MANTKRKPGGLYNSDWGSLIPGIGAGLQAIGLIGDNMDFNKDVEARKTAIGEDYAHATKGLDRQVQSVAQDAGQAMGAGNAANYDMEGASVNMAKAGIGQRYQQAESLAADEKAYQEKVKNRELESIKRQQDAMPLKNLLSGLGIGLGALGSIGENNWFGLADDETDLRGMAFRTRRAE